MECGQCKDCNWWWSDDNLDVGDCYMSESYPDPKYGVISTHKGSLIVGISIGCTHAEQDDVFKAISGTTTDGVSMRTSRYFGCVMFEPRRD